MKYRAIYAEYPRIMALIRADNDENALKEALNKTHLSLRKLICVDVHEDREIKIEGGLPMVVK